MTDQWWSPARQPPQAIPFRNKFDAARDPLTARNAIGAVDAKYVADAIAAAGGGGGGAPTSAQYVTAAADATLTAERVLTNTATVTWDFSTAGQAKANAATGGGGNVSNSGTPTVGQYAKWVTATTIQGVAPATVLSDIGAQPAGSYQPLDGDLTAIAALTGTDTIYFRSGTSTWSGVTIGANLTFAGGTLAASGGGGGTPGGSTTQVQYNNSGAFGGAANLTWNNSTSVLNLAGSLVLPSTGTVSNNPINFGTPGTGIVGTSTSVFLSAGGTNRLSVSSAQCQLTVPLAATTGSVSVVGISFGTTGTGFYGGGTSISAAIAGTNKLTLSATALTMTVPVVLPANPTNNLEAATKQYVDGLVGSAAALTGQCRLVYVSTSQIKLQQQDGMKIKIAGALFDIPVAGVLAAPTGLTAATTYNVYVFNSSGTLTIEFSTTAHVPDTTAGNEGVEIKSGDASRTLVGKVWINTGPAFIDAVATRGVISWFNRRQRIAQTDYVGSTASTAFTDAGTLATFLSWGDEEAYFALAGTVTIGGVATASTQLFLDGTTYILASGNEASVPASGYKETVAGSSFLRLTEASHNFRPRVAVTSGTGTWNIYAYVIFMG